MLVVDKQYSIHVHRCIEIPARITYYESGFCSSGVVSYFMACVEKEKKISTTTTRNSEKLTLNIRVSPTKVIVSVPQPLRSCVDNHNKLAV